MAKELIIVPRKFDQPIVGDKMQMQGGHVRPDSDIRLDAGNTASYVVPDGVQYVELHATAALWFRISSDGGSAVAGQDEYLPADGIIERSVSPKQIIKCVLDA